MSSCVKYSKQKKSTTIPSAPLKKQTAVKDIYLENFRQPFQYLTSQITDFLNNKHYEKKRYYSNQLQSNGLKDSVISTSLEYIKNFDLYKPSENRKAYNHICYALDYAGKKISPYVHYQGLAAKLYCNYIFYLVEAFQINNPSIADLLENRDHQQYFVVINELTDAILLSLEKGELLASSTLLLRLADIYFATFPYVSSAIGVTGALNLLEDAESILKMANDIATKAESPYQMLQ